MTSVTTSQSSGDNPVTVTWTASEGATKYQVERDEVPTLVSDRDVFDSSTATTTYEDNGTEYNTKYAYRVRAGNDHGYGPWSDGARITTQRKPGTPAAPANLTTANTSFGDITLAWGDPPGPEAVDHYSVMRLNLSDMGQQEVAKLDGDAASYTDDTVQERTWYSYWIYASNEHGDSPSTSRQSIETQERYAAPPHKPASLDLSEDTAGEIVVTWTAPASGPEPTAYRLYRQVIGETTAMTLITSVSAPTTAYTDDSVQEGIWYGYEVRAANGQA